MWNLKKKTKFIETESRFAVARGEGGWSVGDRGNG